MHVGNSISSSLQTKVMDQFVTFIDKLFEVFPEYKEKEVNLGSSSRVMDD